MTNLEFTAHVIATASHLRALGHPAARFCAAQLDRAAQLLAFTGASSEEEFDERIAANEASVAEEHFARGYAEGRAAALRAVNGYHHAESHRN
jgi:flagellar biosynthesis/type III secretory pathway protein FliH